jgi:DNA-binding LytR/AlgR family response regulator
MLQALVLEDERAARSYLVELVEATRLARVFAAVPSIDLALRALADTSVDVAFVDVHLVGPRGGPEAGLEFIEAAKSLGTVGRFVITTASRDHAIAAFELGAVDYLTKPFSLSRVRESLERVRQARGVTSDDPAPEGRGEGRVVARKGKALVFLQPGEAWAFEAEDRLTFVHSAEGRLDVDLSLTALEAVLGPTYLRVHRSWLVSLAAVRGIARDDGEMSLLVGGSLTVPVARERAAQVKARLLSRTVGLRGNE